MKTHQLKTDPKAFSAVVRLDKTFEIRKDDRDFKEGDILWLRQTKFTGEEMVNGEPLVYTGKECFAKVSYILRGPVYGLING